MNTVYVIMFRGAPLYFAPTHKEAKEYIQECIRRLDPNVDSGYRHDVCRMEIMAVDNLRMFSRG